MNAEIISVGTELLLGHTVNTDTTIVARALSDLGWMSGILWVGNPSLKRLKKELIIVISY